MLKAVLPDPAGLALLLDDRKLRATTRLTGAAGFAASEARARLLLDPAGSEAVVATGIERRGGDLLLTFPSLALWSIAVKGEKDAFTLPQGSTIEVSLPGRKKAEGGCVEDRNAAPDACLERYRLRYLVRASEPEPAFTLSTSVASVGIEEKGQGVYTFGLGLDESQTVTLAGDGVVVTTVEPATLAKDGVSWTITRPGRITVRLAQLTPGQAFKLKLTDAGGLAREIALTAKALAPEPERQTGGGRS